MAVINTKYMDETFETAYSDGSIEDEFIEFVRNGGDWYSDGRWPIVYHFSHLRHNILNWYPGLIGADVMEIGSGCGALTGLLCQKARYVTSVELTLKRAQVNYQRHSQYENLEIVVGDFGSLRFDKRYDYVIINGVLEYAAYMLQTKDPYASFLRLSAELLRPSGRLLLAIENRLGLKYFSGAREDHTGTFFSGLNGYADQPKLRTFSKPELLDLLHRAGLSPLRFYYPFPDYKFPAIIFTDETINNILPDVTDYPLDMNRVCLYDVNRVRESLMNAKIADQFSNSFFIECATDTKEVGRDISFVKISANRHPKYRIATLINAGREIVRKAALSDEGAEHIQHMGEFSGRIEGRLYNTSCHIEEGTLSYPFLTQPSLETLLVEDFLRGDQGRFFHRIKDLFQALTEHRTPMPMPLSLQFIQTFGSERCEQLLHWIPQGNVDLVASNIFPMQNGVYQVVDYEWHMDCDVPAEFILWRLLRHLEQSYAMQDWLTEKQLIQLTHATDQTLICFARWDEHFCREYVGIRELHVLAKETIPVDLERALTNVLEESIRISTLFMDAGEGFSAQQSMQVRVNYVSGLRETLFTGNALRAALRLRWDPHEGMPCTIDNIDIQTDGHLESLQSINAEPGYDSGCYQFYTFDPQFLLTGDFSQSSYVRIRFQCQEHNWIQGYSVREQELVQSRQELVQTSQELARTTQELVQTSQELEAANNKLAQTQEHLEQTSAKLALVHKSRFWKAWQFLRNLLRRDKRGENQ